MLGLGGCRGNQALLPSHAKKPQAQFREDSENAAEHLPFLLQI